jgi:ribulose-phosphate 3-epimerase
MGKIAPSIMCANFANLGRDIQELEAAGVEYLHFDIMDGSFVPNYTMGPDIMRALRKITDIPFDVHLMIDKPQDKLSYFEFQKGDLVSVHQEATVHLQRTLMKIRETGAGAAVALNPATPLSVIEDVLDDINAVLIMTVNPGYAGQKLVPSTLGKISRLRAMLDASGHSDVEIEVDGNVSFENAVRMRDAGASIYVAGTSSIFIKNMSIPDASKKLRGCI